MADGPVCNMRSMRCPVLWPWRPLTLKQDKGEKLSGGLVMTHSGKSEPIEPCAHKNVKTESKRKNMTLKSKGWWQLLARCQEMWNSSFLLILMALFHLCLLPLTCQCLTNNHTVLVCRRGILFLVLEPLLLPFLNKMSPLNTLFCNQTGGKIPRMLLLLDLIVKELNNKQKYKFEKIEQEHCVCCALPVSLRWRSLAVTLFRFC